MPEACVFIESAYLHKLRVFKSEDDIAIFISIAILKLHMTEIVLRFCVRLALIVAHLAACD